MKREGLTLDPERDAGRSRAERREAREREVESAYEDMERRVGGMMDFLAAVDSCQKDDGEDVVRQKLEAAVAQTEQGMDPELVKDVDTYLNPFDSPELFIKRMIAGNKLLSTEDGQLLLAQRQMTGRLVDYFSQLRKMEVQPEEAERIILESIGQENRPYLSDTVYSAFDVSLVVDPEAPTFRDEHPDSLGYNIPLLPVVVVMKQSKTAQENVLRHERVHNIYNTASRYYMEQPDAIDALEYMSMLRNASDGEIDSHAAHELAELLDADTLVRSVKEEVLAETENAEMRRDRTGSRIYPYSELSTASGQAKRLEADLKELPEIAGYESYEGLDQRFKRAYYRAVSRLDVGTFVGSKLSERAHKFTHAALVTLDPKQYGHIVELLRRNFDAEDVDRLVKVKRVLDGFGELKDVASFMEAFNSGELGEMSSAASIAARFADEIEVPNHLFDTALMTELEQIDAFAKAMSAYVAEHGSEIGLRIEGHEVAKQVWYQVVWKGLEASVQRGESIDVLERVPDDRSDSVLLALEIYCDFLGEDYFNATGEDITMDVLKQMPIWPVIEEYSLQDLYEEAYGDDA